MVGALASLLLLPLPFLLPFLDGLELVVVLPVPVAVIVVVIVGGGGGVPDGLALGPLFSCCCGGCGLIE